MAELYVDPNPFVGYHVTGITRQGKRFKIVTENKMHAYGINLWRGSVWIVRADGTRRLLRRIFN